MSVDQTTIRQQADNLRHKSLDSTLVQGSNQHPAADCWLHVSGVRMTLIGERRPSQHSFTTHTYRQDACCSSSASSAFEQKTIASQVLLHAWD